jgi:hypothetical protein
MFIICMFFSYIFNLFIFLKERNCHVLCVCVCVRVCVCACARVRALMSVCDPFQLQNCLADFYKTCSGHDASSGTLTSSF